MTQLYKCAYCIDEVASFSLMVQHLLDNHHDKEIKYKISDGKRLKTFNFKIIPELCREQGRTITINNVKETIHISKPYLVPKESPFKKILKFTDSNTTQNAASGACITESENDSFEMTNIDVGECPSDEIISLMPKVIETVKENGKLDEYLSFHRLLSEKKFPMDNIAFLLFLDVVRWFSLDGYTTSMRYSEDVKLFWRTCLRLFGGKILRFMGGPKNKGQVVCSESAPGSFNPESSNVNFVVPDRRVLCDYEKFVSTNKPCIIKNMIEKISESDKEQTVTYKICVDGKKINPCSKGEVDLWGNEDSPTYAEKQSRLASEKEFIEDLQGKLEKLETFGKMTTKDCHEDEREQIVENCRRCITLVSERIRDLRALKVKKEIFLQKLMDKCQSDWKSSQFAMVISSIKTNIYQIENCLDDLLECNDSLCYYAAVARNSIHLFNNQSHVDLQSQENLVCLGHNSDKNVESSLLRQRSDAWFELRKKCLITGSTINKAIGLEGLKKQKELLNEKTGRQPQHETPPDLQRMFDYGTSNEINAVSTFVCKFLPAFHPELSFFEEGCYIKTNNGESILIVSPDGSVRNKTLDLNQFGVEIKCPFPGKIYSTPVHYRLPPYYVPQVLSEMDCLGVDKLYYLSYSKDSTTIQKASFDTEVWKSIFAEIQCVHRNNNPTKLSASLPSIKELISNYCDTRVTLVAEVKSCIAKPCDHSSVIDGRTRIYHQRESFESEDESTGNILLRRIRKTFLKCHAQIIECHKLCSQRASEVIVFMLADLDRAYKPELPHAYPIAYGLKGYSMKTEIMNKMIRQVLYELFVKGLYTPVVSYDGQWAKLAFQSQTGEPLTVLELQKKIYNDVKKRHQSVLTKSIFERSVVKAESFPDLLQKISYIKEKTTTVVQGRTQQVYIITVGTLASDQIRTSSNLASLLKTVKGKHCDKENPNDLLDEDNDMDEVLANIPSDLMPLLDEEVVTSLNTIHTTQGHDLQMNRPVDVDINITTMHQNLCSDEEGEDHDKYEQETRKDSPLQNNANEMNVIQYIVPDNADENEQTGMENSGGAPMEIEHSETLIDKEDMHRILIVLQKTPKSSSKFLNYGFADFEKLMKDKSSIAKVMTKAEIMLCMDTFNDSTKNVKLTFFKSWNKSKLIDLLFEALSKKEITQTRAKQSKRRRNPVTLVNSCKKVIKSFPKKILNIIVSEHEFIDELVTWRSKSPFSTLTQVSDLTQLSWFSMPEYNHETFSYMFAFLDVHHLITNCRIKVCKDGFPEREISKSAWIEVAKENKTNLKVSHVEDLIDKQSDAIARETFSRDVETAMRRLGYFKEAIFCKIIREFYEAEDEPGISAIDRCQRRMNLREWLLDGVNFCCFPPYGSHIRGVPNIMFQGFLTNIDRRIQLFPYVKSGIYNVRSLGSLEIENFFGEFQDLDPKGSGVIKAEEIPSALESASQLISTRLMPNRPFHMSLSRAKVYPVHALMNQCGMMSTDQPYLYPQFTNFIQLRDHIFDQKLRSKRKAQRKLATISDPDEAARGVAPVRQFHKCDESKILPHKRLGLELD